MECEPTLLGYPQLILFHCDRCTFSVRAVVHIRDLPDEGMWEPVPGTLTGDWLFRIAREHVAPRACTLTVEYVPPC